MAYAIRMVVVFFTAPKIIHTLGDHQNGIWNLVEGIIGYFALLDLGMGSAIVRFVAKYHAVRDWKNLNRVLSTCLLIFSSCSLIIIIGVCYLAWGFERPLGVDASAARDVRWLLMLSGISLAISFTTEIYVGVLIGMSKFPVLNILRTFGVLGWAAAVFVLLNRGYGLVELVATKVCIDCLVQFTIVWQARRALPETQISINDINRETFDDVRNFAGSAFLIMLAGALSSRSDVIFISLYLTPEFITFFMIAKRLADYAKSFFQTLYFVLTPVFSALDAQNQTEKIREILFTASRYMMYLAIPMQAGFFYLGKAFITLWMSAEHAERSYPVLIILSLPLSISISQSIATKILYGTGRLKSLTLIAICQAAASITLSLLLIPQLGIRGCAWAATIPVLASSIFMCAYTCRIYTVGIPVYLKKTFLKPCLPLPILFGVWWIASYYFPVQSWRTFLAVGTAGTLAYAIAAASLEWGFISALRKLQNHISNLSDKPELNAKN